MDKLDLQALEAARFESDYRKFQAQFAKLQAEQDAFDDWACLPRTDLALIKAQDLQERRRAIPHRLIFRADQELAQRRSHEKWLQAQAEAKAEDERVRLESAQWVFEPTPLDEYEF